MSETGSFTALGPYAGHLAQMFPWYPRADPMIDAEYQCQWAHRGLVRSGCACVPRCGGRAALFDAMLSVQWPVAFLGRPVIGRNGEEAGNGDHIEQEV
jgi:hypothetical protein